MWNVNLIYLQVCPPPPASTSKLIQDRHSSEVLRHKRTQLLKAAFASLPLPSSSRVLLDKFRTVQVTNKPCFYGPLRLTVVFRAASGPYPKLVNPVDNIILLTLVKLKHCPPIYTFLQNYPSASPTDVLCKLPIAFTHTHTHTEVDPNPLAPTSYTYHEEHLTFCFNQQIVSKCRKFNLNLRVQEIVALFAKRIFPISTSHRKLDFSHIPQ
jgi:hypothetical protein